MLSDLKLVKETKKHLIYPNDQRWMVARSIILRKKILVETMKYQSYNIKARVVYELRIKVKIDKVIKWFVLLLWSGFTCYGFFLSNSNIKSDDRKYPLD